MSARHLRIAVAVAAALALSTHCAGPGERPADRAGGHTDRLVGEWLATLLTPLGELPFSMRVDARGEELAAVLINAGEETRVQWVERNDLVVTLLLSDTGSRIFAKMSTRGDSMAGFWSWSVAGRPLQFPFRATRGAGERFAPASSQPSEGRTGGGAAAPPPPSVEGAWEVRAAGLDEAAGGSVPAVASGRSARLAQEGDRVIAAWPVAEDLDLTLEGEYHAGILRLSLFSGEAAVLCHGSSERPDVLEGECWSATTGSVRWHARRIDTGSAP